MTRSRIFSTELYHEVEQRTVELPNTSEDFLSLTTARSPRAVGDAVQEVLCERFAEVIGDLSSGYSSDFARRAMADLAFPIEWLSWDCLTLGALGWGQIQIADSKRLIVMPGYSRRRWMLELCEALLEFYPREIEKIGKRIGYFERVRAAWEARSDGGG